MTERVDNFQGGAQMNSDERAKILSLIPEKGSVLEIGTYHGVTIAWLAKHRPGVQFVSIDPFLDVQEAGVEKGDREHWKANKQINQRLYVGTIRDFIHTSLDEASFNVVIVDGSHAYKDCLQDLILCWPLLKDPGGRIIAHDYNRPGMPAVVGVHKAVDEFCKTFPYSIDETYASMAILKGNDV